MRWPLLLGMLALLAGAGAAEALLFAPADDRRPLAEAEARALGRVVLRDNGIAGTCTGVLVAPDLVLTGAHCVTGSDGLPRPDRVGFMPHAAPPRAVREIVAGTGDPARLEDDWAVMRLDAPVPGGRSLPVLPLEDWQFLVFSGSPLLDQARTARLLAYHGDFHGGRVPAQSTGCGIRGAPDRTFVLSDGKRIGPASIYHDCDAVPASSGGPLVIDRPEGPAIVAIQSSYAAPPAAQPGLAAYSEAGGAFNIGVRAARFAPAVDGMAAR